MTTAKERFIYLTKTAEGAYLAASNTSPFFCFEGTSEVEVTQKAARALDFYESASREGVIAPRPTVSVTPFTPTKLIRRSDLVAA